MLKLLSSNSETLRRQSSGFGMDRLTSGGNMMCNIMSYRLIIDDR